MDIFFQRIDTEDLVTPPPKEDRVSIPNTKLAVLGCGSLGTALLFGVLATIKNQEKENSTLQESRKTQDTDDSTIPTHFAAYVRTPLSASRLATALANFPTHVEIYTSTETLHTVDIIILACQPADLESCLESPEVKSALVGKLVISVLPNISIKAISSIIENPDGTSQQPTTIIRAVPNIASSVRHSMTIVESVPSSTAPSILRTVDWLFNSIGTVKHIPTERFNVCTALCASTPAFLTVYLEALADGAVTMGLSREEATMMATQAMKGCAERILAGEHPVIVKERITTPGGPTIRGLLMLEKGNLRSVVAEALIESTKAV